jgi:methyltransferase (TIGR00027 family)
MIESKPSHTAHRVAMRRAAHQLLDDPIVFRDPLALRILGPAESAAIRAEPRRFEGTLYAAYLRAFLAVRSRVAEDTLRDLVRGGVEQYLVLGAGLDTSAYREPYDGHGVRAFEVDHPATQEWKRQCLAAAAIPIPESLTFVPVNFERQDLESELLRAGVRQDRATFCSWLGVTPYLGRAAIDATLQTVASFCRTGGGIVFDYPVPPETLGLRERAVFEAMAARVRAVGEEWRTSLAPDPLMEQLRELGFTDVTDLRGDDLNARYFADRTDGLRVGSAGHVMIAVRK